MPESGTTPDDNGVTTDERNSHISLTEMDDEELGRRVRETDAFRLAVACSALHREVDAIRSSERVYDQLVGGVAADCQRVSSEDTVREVLDALLDAIERYGIMAESAEEFAGGGDGL